MNSKTWRMTTAWRDLDWHLTTLERKNEKRRIRRSNWSFQDIDRQGTLTSVTSLNKARYITWGLMNTRSQWKGIELQPDHLSSVNELSSPGTVCPKMSTCSRTAWIAAVAPEAVWQVGRPPYQSEIWYGGAIPIRDAGISLVLIPKNSLFHYFFHSTSLPITFANRHLNSAYLPTYWERGPTL